MNKKEGYNEFIVEYSNAFALLELKVTVLGKGITETFKGQLHEQINMEGWLEEIAELVEDVLVEAGYIGEDNG